MCTESDKKIPGKILDFSLRDKNCVELHEYSKIEITLHNHLFDLSSRFLK